MADEQQEQTRIAEKDVQAVAQKLKDWAPTLPEQEQLVLGWVLQRAAAAGDNEDVVEYAQRSAGAPLSNLMAAAAGLEEVSPHAMGGTAVVYWPYKF